LFIFELKFCGLQKPFICYQTKLNTILIHMAVHCILFI
jgi:hypothetical protein